MAAEVVAQTGLELFNGLGLELRQSFVQIQARAFVLHTRDEVMIRVLRLAPRRSGPSKLGTRSSFSGGVFMLMRLPNMDRVFLRSCSCHSVCVCVCVYVCACLCQDFALQRYTVEIEKEEKKKENSMQHIVE